MGSGGNAPGEACDYVAGFRDQDSKAFVRDHNAYLFIPGVVFCVLSAILAIVMPENPAWEQQQQKLDEGEKHGAAADAEGTPVRTWILGVMGCVALHSARVRAVCHVQQGRRRSARGSLERSRLWTI